MQGPRGCHRQVSSRWLKRRDPGAVCGGLGRTGGGRVGVQDPVGGVAVRGRVCTLGGEDPACTPPPGGLRGSGGGFKGQETPWLRQWHRRRAALHRVQADQKGDAGRRPRGRTRAEGRRPALTPRRHASRGAVVRWVVAMSTCHSPAGPSAGPTAPAMTRGAAVGTPGRWDRASSVSAVVWRLECHIPSWLC